MKSELGGMLVHQKAGTSSMCVVDLPCTVDGGEGSCDIGQDTSETNVIGFSWDALEGKGLLDGFLTKYRSVRAVSGGSGIWYQVLLNTGHHVGILLLVLAHANLTKDRVGAGSSRDNVGVSLELLLGELLFVLDVDVVHGAARLVTSKGLGDWFGQCLWAALAEGT